MNLEELRVASPCHESWDNMTGDERARHCAKCDLCVYNIADMTRQEALDFIGARQGKERTCIRMLRRFDGTVITSDCPVGVRKRRLTLVGMLVGGAAAAAAAVAAAASYRPSGGGSNPIRTAYLESKEKVLSITDDLSHRYNIPSLCNCTVRGPAITMGVMLMTCPDPSPAPSPDPPPEPPPEDPFAAPGKE